MEQKRVFLALVLVSLLLGLAGCWNGLVHSDPQEPIVVDAGQTFALSLPGDPSGQRVWEMTQPPDASVAQLTTEKDVRRVYVNLSDKERNESFWIFRATGKGETTITMALVDKDSKAVVEERTFTVQVR